MDVVRHLTEPFLALARCVLRLQAFRNVAQDHHVAPGNVVSRRSVSHRHLRAVSTNELNLSTLLGAFLEGLPLPVELLAVSIELRKGLFFFNDTATTEKG